MNAVFAKTTQSRLSELEATKEKLKFEMDTCMIQQPTLTEKHIAFMLSQFQRETSDTLEEYNKNVIECFVNAVYLYDDKLIVTYNLADNVKKTELFRSILFTLPDKGGNSATFSGSDIDCSAAIVQNQY